MDNPNVWLFAKRFYIEGWVLQPSVGIAHVTNCLTSTIQYRTAKIIVIFKWQEIRWSDPNCM
jgi:hypothetical protein